MTTRPLSEPETPVTSADRAEPPGHGALLASLGVATFMVALDGRVVAPLLPTIARDCGVSIADASWLVSAYMLPYGLCQLAYGPLADRFGKVRVATHAMVAFSVGTALCGAFGSFTTMVVLRALTGAAAAALIPLTIAYIGDTVPYERRQAALALLMASTGAAQAFSTSAGGTIAALVSWRSVFPLLGALAGAATLALFAYRSRELAVAGARGAPRTRYGDVLAAPRMKRLLALVAMEGVLYAGAFSFLSALLEQRFGLDALAIGLLMGLCGIAQLVSARLLPPLLARSSERALMLFGGSAMSVGYLLSAVAPGLPLAGVACVLIGGGFSFCHSTLQTRATEAYPPGRGTALALFAFALFSGGALGTACLGYIAEAIGYASTFVIVAALLALFTATLVRLLGRAQPSSLER